MHNVRWEIRPLGPWLTAHTADRRSGSAFRASWQSTMDLLLDEAYLLGAVVVVVQVDVLAGDLRRDGMLRAGARIGFPGVRVSFGSIHGPLTYATDAYVSWQANIRAIALSLTALRAVDRYGVSHSGEQYRGWTAIESGASRPQMSVDEAARLLADEGESTAALVLADPAERSRAFKRAAHKHHPDFGGNPDAFGRLTAARDLVDQMGPK